VLDLQKRVHDFLLWSITYLFAGLYLNTLVVWLFNLVIVWSLHSPSVQQSTSDQLMTVWKIRAKIVKTVLHWTVLNLL